MPTLIEDICAYGGCDNLADALANWQAEREAMRELQDINNALKIVSRRTRVIIDLCSQAFNIILDEGTMFLNPKVISIVIKAREQITLQQNYVANARELFE